MVPVLVGTERMPPWVSMATGQSSVARGSDDPPQAGNLGQ